MLRARRSWRRGEQLHSYPVVVNEVVRVECACVPPGSYPAPRRDTRRRHAGLSYQPSHLASLTTSMHRHSHLSPTLQLLFATLHSPTPPPPPPPLVLTDAPRLDNTAHTTTSRARPSSPDAYRHEFLGPDPRVAGYWVDADGEYHIKWYDAFLKDHWVDNREWEFDVRLNARGEWVEVDDVD
ncbi:hypothetical protein GY45DRAFT_1329805 [Cubamyces sp. BRFM 1775]|nr:hypothetical protein GY45DRAFT_1329805 [Cubamyces sp. BRFM 1775]